MLGQRTESPRVGTIETETPVPPDGYGPGLLQDFEMLRYRAERDVHSACDVSRSALLPPYQLQDLLAPRFGNCLKKIGHDDILV